MEDVTYIFRWTARWLIEHPLVPIAAIVVLVVLRVLLNRKSRLTREAEREISRLKQENKGKYDELRPLR